MDSTKVVAVVAVAGLFVCVLALSCPLAEALPGDDEGVYINCGPYDPNPGGDYQEAREKAITKLLKETVRRNYAMYYRKGSNAGMCYAFARCRLDIPPDNCQRCLEMLDEAMTDGCMGDRLAAEAHYQECDMKYANSPFDPY